MGDSRTSGDVVADDDFIYVATIGQTIEVYDRDTGTLQSSTPHGLGGIVFALALDADSGEVLWKFQTGSSIRSQPVTWQMDGRQFVAIGSGAGGIVSTYVGSPDIITTGSALLVFALPSE